MNLEIEFLWIPTPFNWYTALRNPSHSFPAIRSFSLRRFGRPQIHRFRSGPQAPSRWPWPHNMRKQMWYKGGMMGCMMGYMMDILCIYIYIYYKKQILTDQWIDYAWNHVLFPSKYRPSGFRIKNSWYSTLPTMLSSVFTYLQPKKNRFGNETTKSFKCHPATDVRLRIGWNWCDQPLASHVWTAPSCTSSTG